MLVVPVGKLWSAEIVFRSSMKSGRLKGKKSFWSRIRIHTGNTLVGNIGSVNRMNYVVVGDSVILEVEGAWLCLVYSLLPGAVGGDVVGFLNTLLRSYEVRQGTCLGEMLFRTDRDF